MIRRLLDRILRRRPRDPWAGWRDMGYVTDPPELRPAGMVVHWRNPAPRSRSLSIKASSAAMESLRRVSIPPPPPWTGQIGAWGGIPVIEDDTLEPGRMTLEPIRPGLQDAADPGYRTP